MMCMADNSKDDKIQRIVIRDIVDDRGRRVGVEQVGKTQRVPRRSSGRSRPSLSESVEKALEQERKAEFQEMEGSPGGRAAAERMQRDTVESIRRNIQEQGVTPQTAEGLVRAQIALDRIRSGGEFRAGPDTRTSEQKEQIDDISQDFFRRQRTREVVAEQVLSDLRESQQRVDERRAREASREQNLRLDVSPAIQRRRDTEAFLDTTPGFVPRPPRFDSVELTDVRNIRSRLREVQYAPTESFGGEVKRQVASIIDIPFGTVEIGRDLFRAVPDMTRSFTRSIGERTPVGGGRGSIRASPFLAGIDTNDTGGFVFDPRTGGFRQDITLDSSGTTLRDFRVGVDEFGTGIGRQLQEDSVKGAVLVGLDIGLGVVPLTGFTGTRLAGIRTARTVGKAPVGTASRSRRVVDITTDFKGDTPFLTPQQRLASLGIKSDDFFTVKTPGSTSVVTPGAGTGQLDLFGRSARSTPSTFKPGDFVPVGEDPFRPGRLRFVSPDSPELRSTVYTAFSPGVRNVDAKLRDVFSGVLDAFGQPVDKPFVAVPRLTSIRDVFGKSKPSDFTIVGSGVRQTDLMSFGFREPIIVRDTLTGRTFTRDSRVLVDFLSEQPGRFQVVRKPASTTERYAFDLGTRQTRLVDDKSNFLFASVVPVPPSFRDAFGKGTLFDVSKTFKPGKTVTTTPSTVVGTSPRPSLTAFPSAFVSRERQSEGLSPSVDFRGVSERKIDFDSMTDSRMASLSAIRFGSRVGSRGRTRTGVDTSLGLKQSLVTESALTPGLTTEILRPVRDPPSGLKRLKPPRTPRPRIPIPRPRIPRPRIPRFTPTLDFDFSRTRRESFSQPSGFTGRVPGIRTAQPGRAFLTGRVDFVKPAQEFKVERGEKRKKVFWDTNFRISFGGRLI